MRLTIKTLSYRNFLSSGAADISIDFTTHPTLLITGGNGAGKSTVLDALCFALFGKPFRNVTKATVVNSVNSRDCVVDISFDIGTDAYRVVRGIKPNIFDIYKNGSKIDALPDIRDQQSYLEDDILRLNRKAFLQVVILGKAGYIPFMLLTAAQRREVVEELLDIGIFSRMSEKAKVLHTQVQSDLQRAMDKLDGFAPMNDLLLEQFESAKRDHEAMKARLQADIDRAKLELMTMVAPGKYDEESHKSYVAALEDMIKNVDEVNETIRDLTSKLDSETKELKAIEARYANEISIKRMETKMEIDAAEEAIRSNDDRITAIELARDNDIRQLMTEKSGFQRDATRIKRDIDGCVYRIENAENERFCKSCGQEIALSNHDHIRKEAEKERKALLVEIKKIDKEMDRIDKKIEEIKRKANDDRAAFVRNNPDLHAALNTLVKRQESLVKTLEDEKNKTIQKHKDGPIAEISFSLNSAKRTLQLLQDNVSQHKKVIKGFEDVKVFLATFEASLKLKEARLADMMTSLELIPEETDMMKSIKVKIGETKTKTEKASKKVDEIRDFLAVTQVATKLLKDDGIKAAVVSRYLPTLNNLINAYLQKLGLMVSFEFSPTFEESIRSRYLDDFRYENFSEGEKMRIELALLFAWRKIAKLKSSLDCNLVFFDEVFDASLDTEGCDQFLSIVNEMDSDGTHAIMISHKDSDQFIDKFARHIHFEKVDGFSAYHEIVR